MASSVGRKIFFLLLARLEPGLALLHANRQKGASRTKETSCRIRIAPSALDQEGAELTAVPSLFYVC
jgi:hypothetical protein